MGRIIGGLHATLNLIMLIFFPLISQLPQVTNATSPKLSSVRR
jgi:hypothetical protein